MDKRHRNTAYKKIIQAGNTREITKTTYKGYAPISSKRNAKAMPSPAWIKKHNARIRAKKVRIIVNNNFTAGDYFLTLTYNGDRPTQERSERVLKTFFQWIRRRRKKQGAEFKYIMSTEGGEAPNRRRIHHHIIINNAGDIDELIKYWTKNNGLTKYVPIYSTDLAELSEYITKTAGEYLPHEGEQYSRIRHSRNLIMPLEEVEEISMKELIEEASPTGSKEPKPSPGYYIPKDSIIRTVNPITGAYAIYYRELKLQHYNTYKPRRKRKHSTFRPYHEPYCMINAEGVQEMFLNIKDAPTAAAQKGASKTIMDF